MVGVRGWHGGRLPPTEQAEEGPASEASNSKTTVEVKYGHI